MTVNIADDRIVAITCPYRSDCAGTMQPVRAAGRKYNEKTDLPSGWGITAPGGRIDSGYWLGSVVTGTGEDTGLT